MDLASSLQATLERHHPAAARCLSDIGRRLYFPRGIPSQAAEASGCRYNATIGEFTDGEGFPLCLPLMREAVPDLDPRWAFLYSPQAGREELRRAWLDKLLEGQTLATTIPIVTAGISQGLSVLAELFTDADTDVVLPRPAWDVYRLMFGVRRGARIVDYDIVEDGRFSVEPLRRTLASVKRKALIILNFPSNPTGYSPTEAEARALCEVLRAHPGPLVVVLDDAYQGLWFEPDIHHRSLFHDLANASPEKLLVAKVDGATKELAFFGGRVGFITFGASKEAAGALEDKVRGCIRATTSSPSGIPQALVLRALRDPRAAEQRRAVFDTLKERYTVLREGIERLGFATWPFNSGCFALLSVKGDAEDLRRRLIAEAGVGVVSHPEVNGIRLAFCSVRASDIPGLLEVLRPYVG